MNMNILTQRMISAYNSKRLSRIASDVFKDDQNIKVLDIFNRTEIIFDMFGRVPAGVHPGSGGGAGWVLNSIERFGEK